MARSVTRVLVLLCTLPLAAPAWAQLDCDDVDHDCTADAETIRGLRRGGSALLRCMRDGTDPCDLTTALSVVTDPECRAAVECQLLEVRALLGDGSTSCVQGLFRRTYRFMAAKTSLLRRDRFDLVPSRLQRCKDHAASQCDDPIAPPLTGVCAGDTTPAAGADCVCDAGGVLTDRLVLTPGTCLEPPAPEPAAHLGIRPLGGAPRPNIVLILSDDQRWDTVDATHASPGRPGPVMPIVTNELIDSGVTFTNGHVTTALCCPSRTSILTGEYAHRTGVHDNTPPDGGAEVFDDSSTLATWLQAAGYRTGFVGKYLNGYASLSPCVPPGWDDWHVQVQVKFYEYDLNDNGVITHFASGPADYSGDVMTQRAVDFIHSSTGPFFLHLSQKAPHGPATPAPRHIGLFAGIAPFRPANYAATPLNGPAWVVAETWTANETTNTDLFRQAQLESLQAVDEGVGAVMQALRDIGEDDNTLVVYTSDNGFSWGSHKWRPKQCPYEECVRVPMVMRYPPLGTTPRTDDRFVLNIDLAPTFVELAEATVPPTHVVNGASVVPLLAGGAVAWRDDMLNEHWGGVIPDNGLVKQGRCSATQTTVCKVAGDCPGGESCVEWKYVAYVTGETELYDLSADPFELDNVTDVPANAGVRAALAARLAALQAE
jgi:N-acetylglucosamine-6-sulfatase